MCVCLPITFSMYLKIVQCQKHHLACKNLANYIQTFALRREMFSRIKSINCVDSKYS